MVLWYEISAFCLLIAISWGNEFLSPRLFGSDQSPSIEEGVLETIVIVIVAIPIVLLTRRVVTRLFYLEGFLNVCAWCEKVEHGGSWIPVADFFKKRFDVETSHGMCPACFAAKFGTAPVSQGT
jgi:hypothetical protein